jgi:hypothetical protein
MKKKINSKKKTLKKKITKKSYRKIIGGMLKFNNKDVDKILIPYEQFRTFFLENKDKILFPVQNNGKHTLNKSAFDNIEKRIRKYNADETEQNTFILFLKYLKDTIRYVTFGEYFNKLKEICQNIKTQIIDDPSYTTIILCAQDQISKSNLWVLLLCLYYLDDDIEKCILKNKKKIYVTSDIGSAYKYCASNYEKNNRDDKVAFLFFDDMSYSGTQIKSSLPKKNMVDNIKVFLAVSFVSDTAIQNISSECKFELFDNTEIVESNKEQLNKWITNNKDKIISTLFPGLLERNSNQNNNENSKILELFKECIYTIFCNESAGDEEIIMLISKIESERIKSIKKNILLSIANIQKTKTIAFMCYSSIIPIYFDHKVADAVSTFQKFLRFGSYPTDNDDKNTCIYESIINNCTPITEEIKSVRENMCITGYYVDDEDECPDTFYKPLIYTFKGRPISLNEKKIKTINDLF